eukprot:SM000143S00721  [mRNA]  locus=s143:45777:46264:+ [translate_table: standard]
MDLQPLCWTRPPTPYWRRCVWRCNPCSAGFVPARGICKGVRAKVHLMRQSWLGNPAHGLARAAQCQPYSVAFLTEHLEIAKAVLDPTSHALWGALCGKVHCLLGRHAAGGRHLQGVDAEVLLMRPNRGNPAHGFARAH